MAAEGPYGPVAAAPPDIFHVHIEDSRAESANEFHVIDALIGEMRRIEIKAEAAMAPDRIEGALALAISKAILASQNGAYHSSYGSTRTLMLRKWVSLPGSCPCSANVPEPMRRPG